MGNGAKAVEAILFAYLSARLRRLRRVRLRVVAGHDATVAQQARAGCDRLDHGLGRAARHIRTERQKEFEVIGVREPALQMRRETVARDHVEAGAQASAPIGRDVAENGPATQSTAETSLIAAFIRAGSPSSNARAVRPSGSATALTFRRSRPARMGRAS